MLADVRVLELSAPETMLAGQILGDLGADVICLEPPGGAAGRRLEPFIGGLPGLDRSLTWHGLNRNKRGATLDLRHPDGAAVFATLASKADVVICASGDAQALADAEWDAASADRLIVAEIAPFALGGPKGHYAAADLVLMAAGGAPAMAGDADRAPRFFPVGQAKMEAGAEAAVAILAALAARDRSGLGQRVEINAHIATTLGSLGRIVSGGSGDRLSTRTAPAPRGAMPPIPGIFACRDGFMVVSIILAPAFMGMTQHIVQWLFERGDIDADDAARDWLATALNLMGDAAGDPAPIQRLVAAVAGACARLTKSELVVLSQKHRFMAAPAMDMADVAGFDHFQARGLFTPQLVGDVSIAVPARFAQFSDYQIEVRRPAPNLSQHTAEILASEVGLSSSEIQALFVHGAI
jgi:crotonobetainyl-CoA:carnitine CoA-transferase CaiB-like acyl-CoA transferase